MRFLILINKKFYKECKKASTAPGGDGPTKEDEVKPPSNLGSTGLFDTQTKLDEYKEKPIQQSTEVAKYENGNYMRNPVITVVGGSTVVVFYEIRYQTAGAGNDVALTGENAVSIAYVQSKDSGISFSTTGMGEPKFVGGAASSGAADAHGAPIVFNTGKEIVVVASAGIGLSSGVYQAGTKESKLQYSVATITGDTVGDFGRNIVRADMQSITVASPDGNMIEGIDFCIGMNAATVDCGSRVNIDGQVAERKGLPQKIDGIPFVCGRRIVYAAVDFDGTARSAVNDVTEARGGVDDEIFACVDDQSSAFAEF